MKWRATLGLWEHGVVFTTVFDPEEVLNYRKRLYRRHRVHKGLRRVSILKNSFWTDNYLWFCELQCTTTRFKTKDVLLAGEKFSKCSSLWCLTSTTVLWDQELAAVLKPLCTERGHFSDFGSETNTQYEYISPLIFVHILIIYTTLVYAKSKKSLLNRS